MNFYSILLIISYSIFIYLNVYFYNFDFTLNTWFYWAVHNNLFFYGMLSVTLKYSFIFCFKYFLRCALPCPCEHQVSSAIVLPKAIFPSPRGIPQNSVIFITVFKASAKFDIWDVQHFFYFLWSYSSLY